jgi:hypothetical protein
MRRHADAANDPRVPTSLSEDSGPQQVRAIALAVIWVLGLLAILAWAFRL